MKTEAPASIDVWRQYNVDQPWTVSLCDDEGGEIRCLEGADSAEDGYRRACEIADAEQVPARLIGEDGQVLREYTPEAEVDE